MKPVYQCLSCLVGQAVRVVEMSCEEKDREPLLKSFFARLSQTDLSRPAPDLVGNVFALLREKTGCADPYHETRRRYNDLMLSMLDALERAIDSADDPFEQAVRYAILGNIIDFAPGTEPTEAEIVRRFALDAGRAFAINRVGALAREIQKAKRILYLGDNCGEICLDKLLLKKIRACNPDAEMFFGVRGAPVLNDSIEEDAYRVGIDAYAQVVSNGSGAAGTMLDSVSPAFRGVYDRADVIIAKGQGNYESLGGRDENLYFLLMAKCGVIARRIGVPAGSLICMDRRDAAREAV